MADVEVAGEAVPYVAPSDVAAMQQALLDVQRPDLREKLTVARRQLSVMLHRLTTDRPVATEWWCQGVRLDVSADRPAGMAASAMLDKIQKKYRTDPSFHIWAIEEAGRYAGHAELKRRTGRVEYELVYMLRKDSWGRSLGGRVVDALIAEAKDRDIPFVIATVHPENAASIAILRRRGFALDEALTRELDVTAYRRELA